MSKPIPYGHAGTFPVQRTKDGNQPFGTDKSVPYAHIETLSTQQTRQTPICPLWARMVISMAICIMKNAGQG
ncbi:MAG: hypothetical protein SPE19_06495, partial [Candidatus Faecousia sp.]|nr:hypothetical protein [Candidatus Faecousia sp.]